MNLGTILALTLFLEAQGEPWAGKVLVAEVIVNRARASGRSVAEVCLAPKQFSCWNEPSRSKKLLREVSAGKHRNDIAWNDCLLLAELICRPDFKPSTQATHYYNPALCSPRWAKGMTVCARVGNHIFLMEK